jgi:hypothetical protein
MTHPLLFIVTPAWPESSMDEFSRPKAAADQGGRFTAAKKNDTSAETYGEPQTPAEPA